MFADSHVSVPVQPTFSESVEERAARLHRWIVAYHERLKGLADALDERWILQRFGFTVVRAWRTSGSRQRLQLLLTLLDPAAPTIAGLSHLANRLALLPVDQLHAVLLARALFARATSLRRCVDGTLLDRVAQALGPDGERVMWQLQKMAGTDKGEDLTLLETTGQEEWCRDGLWRFECDRVWSDPFLKRMIRMTMPPPFARHQQKTRKASTDSFVFLGRLSVLYPETSWLFG